MKKTNRSPHSSQKGLGLSRREALRRAAGFGALASLSSFGLGIPESAEAAEEGFGIFPKHPKWKFVFVNHVTTNPFFVPDQSMAPRMPARFWAVPISGPARRNP